jgi:hypothetical protein
MLIQATGIFLSYLLLLKGRNPMNGDSFCLWCFSYSLQACLSIFFFRDFIKGKYPAAATGRISRDDLTSGFNTFGTSCLVS